MIDTNQHHQDQLKQAAAVAAMSHIPDSIILGVGSGSTVHFLIDELAKIKNRIMGAVAASETTAEKLRAHGIRVLDLNEVDVIPLYIDGADEINPQLQMIKGGGAALTREKIIAAVAERFICIADVSKSVRVLGQFPIPIEVIPMARSYVARELVQLGGRPVYRQGVITDNGNVLLDMHGLMIGEPAQLEAEINQIAGVVTNGIFARRRADLLLLSTVEGVHVFN